MKFNKPDAVSLEQLIYCRFYFFVANREESLGKLVGEESDAFSNAPHAEHKNVSTLQ
jgi:hypothetical protein